MNASAVSVRSMAEGDVRTLAELHVSVWRSAYRGLLPDEFLAAQSIEHRERLWQQAIARTADSPVFVAEAEARIVGFISCGASRDDDAAAGATAEVYAIYVAPEWWGRSVGAQLMRQALAALSSLHYREVTLWVLYNNALATRFYERMGFELDGAVKREIDGDVVLDEVRYRRSLSHAKA